MPLRYTFATLVCLWCLQIVGEAHAGPVEIMTRVALQPGNPNTMLVRYTGGGGGFFYTRDGGASWQLLCLAAIDLKRPRGETEPFAIAGDGTTWIGLEDGAGHDDEKGCEWSTEPSLVGQSIVDIVTHPTEPGILFALTSSSGMQNGLWRRDADGTWTEFGSRDDVALQKLLVTTHGTGLRYYESALRITTVTASDGTETNQVDYFIRVSDDEGKTWQEHAVDADGGSVVLRAVDPNNPDRVVLTVNRDGADDSVMVSSDQAATFEEYLKVSEFGGIALAADGRLWIGESGTMVSGASRGLWFSSSLDAQAQKLGEYTVKCVAHEPATDTVYICQNFAFGKVASDGTFSASLQFIKAQAFLSCPGSDTAAECKVALCASYCGPNHYAIAPLCAAYTEPTCGPCADDSSSEACLAVSQPPVPTPVADSGVVKPDATISAAPDAGPIKPPGRNGGSGCSCAAVGAHALHSSMLLSAGLCLALTAVWRRRRAAQ